MSFRDRRKQPLFASLTFELLFSSPDKLPPLETTVGPSVYLPIIILSMMRTNVPTHVGPRRTSFEITVRISVFDKKLIWN